MSYCAIKRHGMYTTGTDSKMDRAVSSCGDYAEFKDETSGEALCLPHARYAVRVGHKVTPAIECADCPPTDRNRIPCIECPRRAQPQSGN